MKNNNVREDWPVAEYLSIGDVAERYGVLGKTISDLFYLGKVDRARCPVLGGRRFIPRDYAREIGRVLKALGKLPQRETATR
jgi:hypothetical protein